MKSPELQDVGPLVWIIAHGFCRGKVRLRDALLVAYADRDEHGELRRGAVRRAAIGVGVDEKTLRRQFSAFCDVVRSMPLEMDLDRNSFLSVSAVLSDLIAGRGQRRWQLSREQNGSKMPRIV